MATKEAPEGALTQDPELKAMVRISKALQSLDPDGRARVMAWVIGRHCPGRFRIVVEGEANCEGD